MLGHFRESQGLGVRGLEPLLFSMVSAGPCTHQVRLHTWCLTYLLFVTSWRRKGLTCQMSHTPGVLHSHCVLHAAVGVWEKRLCLTRRGRWCGNCTSVLYHTLRLTRGGCCVGTALVSYMPRLLCFERHSCLTRLGCCVGKALMSYTRRLLYKTLASYTTHCVLHSAAVVWERHLCLTHRGGCVGKPLVSYMPRRLCGKLHKRQNDVNANYVPAFLYTCVSCCLSDCFSRNVLAQPSDRSLRCAL